MSDEIQIQQTLPMRARPDVLYRLVLEPKRRVAWDPNLTKAEYADTEQARLANNILVNFKFSRRLMGIRFQAKYGQLQAPQRGGWESVRHVGPLEKFTQSWKFKSMPGGTEVTMSIRAKVRYKWVRAPVERMLHNMVYSTLMALQRQVDANTAQMMEDVGKEMAAKRKAEERAARKRKKK